MLVLILAVAIGQAEPPSSGITAPKAEPLAAATIPWRSRPSAEDFARVFPGRAMRQDVEGRVVLSCTMRADGTLGDCAVNSEEPDAMGFGAAALRLAPGFHARVEADPSIVGKQVRLPIRFNLPKAFR